MDKLIPPASRQFFQQIQDSVESALISYYRLATILNGPTFSDFSAAFREFSRQFSEVQKTQANSSQLVAGTRKGPTSIVQSLRKQADVLKEELDRLKTEGEKDRKTITGIHRGEYPKSNGHPLQLTSRPNNCRPPFRIINPLSMFFKMNWKSEKRLSKQGRNNKKSLLKNLTGSKRTLKSLQNNAEGMLTGSTVAGLAGSFGELRDKLGN